jgi:hypothetical protein
MTSPDVLGLGNGTAILTGKGLVEASRLIGWAIRELSRRDAIQAPRLARLDTVLRSEAAASMAANGHPDRHTEDAMVGYPQDLLTTDEVAALMQISPRHVRRKALELCGRKRGHDWLFDPVIVAAAAAQKPEKGNR